VARHQGRHAADAGRHRLLVAGCLGALGRTAHFEVPNAKGLRHPIQGAVPTAVLVRWYSVSDRENSERSLAYDLW
jgi:hypothetical protein